MLRQAKKWGLKITVDDRERSVSSISKIGKIFQLNDSVDCDVTMNNILNEVFDEDRGFQYYYESSVMSKLRLKHIADVDNDKYKWSIAIM